MTRMQSPRPARTGCSLAHGLSTMRRCGRIPASREKLRVHQKPSVLGSRSHGDSLMVTPRRPNRTAQWSAVNAPNRPVRSVAAAMPASAAPLTLSSAPIFSAESAGPGPIVAVATNKAIVNPIVAMNPITTSSRQPTRCGRCSRSASADPDTDQQTDRFGRQRKRQAPGAPVKRLERDARRSRVRKAGAQPAPDAGRQLESAQRVVRLGQASTKKPGSVRACGKKRHDGTSASAGSNPPKYEG